MSRSPSQKYRNVYSYPVQGGRKWGAVADHGMVNGKRRRPRHESFDKEKEARDWQIAELAKGWIDPDSIPAPVRDVTLGAWIEDWLLLRESELKWGTVQGYRWALKRFGPLLERPLGSITAAEIEVQLAKMRSELSAGTVRQARRVLSICYSGAVALDVCGKNPVAQTRAGKPADEVRVFLNRQQMAALLAVARKKKRWWLQIWVLAETWMRIGELGALKWSDVRDGSIRVARTVRAGADGYEVGDTAKSASSVRTIPISEELHQALVMRRDQDQFRAREDGERWHEGRLIFRGETGALLNRNRLRLALASYCKEAGVPVVSAHDLRHSGASIAARGDAQAGIPRMDPAVVKERLGHASTRFTFDTYIHPNEDDHKVAAELMASLLGVG